MIIWTRHSDEYGNPQYFGSGIKGVYAITRNGAGRMKYTLEYPNGDGAFAETLKVLKHWAALHDTE